MEKKITVFGRYPNSIYPQLSLINTRKTFYIVDGKIVTKDVQGRVLDYIADYVETPWGEMYAVGKFLAIAARGFVMDYYEVS